MKHLSAVLTAAVVIAILVTPTWAQTPAPIIFGQLQWPSATQPDPYRYRLVSPTPDDAYREGLINRWELEQLVGPTPPALQGPSPNGSRGY